MGEKCVRFLGWLGGCRLLRIEDNNMAQKALLELEGCHSRGNNAPLPTMMSGCCCFQGEEIDATLVAEDKRAIPLLQANRIERSRFNNKKKQLFFRLRPFLIN